MGKVKKRYKKELEERDDLIDEIKKDADSHNVTLLYAAKDTEYNQAVDIKEYIEKNKKMAAATFLFIIYAKS